MKYTFSSIANGYLTVPVSSFFDEAHGDIREFVKEKISCADFGALEDVFFIGYEIFDDSIEIKIEGEYSGIVEADNEEEAREKITERYEVDDFGDLEYDDMLDLQIDKEPKETIGNTNVEIEKIENNLIQEIKMTNVIPEIDKFLKFGYVTLYNILKIMRENKKVLEDEEANKELRNKTELAISMKKAASLTLGNFLNLVILEYDSLEIYVLDTEQIYWDYYNVKDGDAEKKEKLFSDFRTKHILSVTVLGGMMTINLV